MFGLFGKKNTSSCAECEKLRTDNVTLIGRVSSLSVAYEELKRDLASSDSKVKSLSEELSKKSRPRKKTSKRK